MTALLVAVAVCRASENDKRMGLGVGLLYENGMDVTLSFEREKSYHNSWEFFANGYLKWAKCNTCGHICPKSFWQNYRTWSVGAAYKPCVGRGRNSYGNIRTGASIGSSGKHIIGDITAGYERNYRLRHGWQLFWQTKVEFVIGGRDHWRTGVVVGFKFPTN